jgi:hypothetical protein
MNMHMHANTLSRSQTSSSTTINRDKKPNMDFGGSASALLPGNYLNGLSSKDIIDSDRHVIKAEREQDKTLEKIELTERKIAAFTQFKKLVQDIITALEPLSALPVNGNITLFGDYNIALTSQDAEDAEKYISVSRIEDDGTTLAFMGIEQQYKIYIKQLAKADTYDFNKSFASATTALGFSGTLKMNGTSFTIQTNQNLNTIVSNINDAAIGVFLTLIKNGDSTYGVSMRSSSTGLNSALDLTNQSNFADETDNAGDRLFGGLTKAIDLVTIIRVPAQNAIIKIDDSADKTYQSNDITNALSGLSFKLLSPNSAASKNVTIVLSKNIDKVSAAIIQYAAATNEINKFYKIHTFSATEGQEKGCLVGESSFDPMYNTLRGMIDSSSDGLNYNLKFLNQLGFVYRNTEESKDEDGVLIPKYLAFSLESDTSVRDKVSEYFENVQKIFEIDFSPDDSGLKLLTCGNKLSENKVFNFSLIINNNNLTGNDTATGLAYNHTKKVAITYTKKDRGTVTIYPPVYEVNASGTGVVIKFPLRSEKAIAGYDPKASNFEGMTLFYSSLPTTNTEIAISFSQGTGNKVFNYARDMTKNLKLGGVIDSAIQKLKDDLSAEKKKKTTNEEALATARARAEASFQRNTAQMGQASYNSNVLTALNKERTKGP